MDLEPPSLLFAINLLEYIGILPIILLLICSGLISGSEVAIFSLTSKNINEAKEIDASKGNILEKFLDNPKQLLATLLISNNFVNIGIVILFKLNNWLDAIAIEWLRFTIEVIVITGIILLFGEILPKIYGNRNNVQFALRMASSIHFLNKLLMPLNLPMKNATIYLEKKMRKEKSNLSVDTLSQALDLTNKDENNEEENKILEGIVKFGNTQASEVMRPRIDVFAIDIHEKFETIFPEILEKGYSRIPVFEENIDQIKGILFTKDLLPHFNQSNFEWQTLIREPFFAPENKKLDDILKDFKTLKYHLAIVVDEYGGTSGIITLEDIIEEIVGDLSDEFDETQLNYTKINENTYIFEGKLSLKDFFKIVELEESKIEKVRGEAETLAGFLLELLSNFPKKGQKIIFENYTFIIEQMDKKRIKQIKLIINNE
ncbi:MAG: gliding motility-associated protein GldE [Flavobacterium sp.]